MNVKQAVVHLLGCLQVPVHRGGSANEASGGAGFSPAQHVREPEQLVSSLCSCHSALLPLTSFIV